MIVVSGVSRSGTSLMMDIMRRSGLPIIGKSHLSDDDLKYSREYHALKNSYTKWQNNNNLTDDDAYRYSVYPPGFSGTVAGLTLGEFMDALEGPKTKETARSKCLEYARRKMRKKDDRDFMNPNGFWEDIYAVQGIFYRFGDEDRLNLLEKAHEAVVKIVARGIVKSDPKYVDKIILMARPPREVATSQENLVREFPLEEMNEMKVNNPEMFINVSIGMCRWLAKHDKPVLVVEYNKLLDDPDTELKRVEEFVSVPYANFSSAAIDKKLRRSKAEDIKDPNWDLSEWIYGRILEKDFKAVADREYPELMNWPCLKTGNQTNPARCLMCRSNPVVRANLMLSGGERWGSEPCMYECGMGPDEPISFEESAKRSAEEAKDVPYDSREKLMKAYSEAIRILKDMKEEAP